MLTIIVRLIAMVDLVNGNWIYSEKVAVALSELSLPFAISSFMLLSLYWHEMMTSSAVVVHPFVTKMRIPFFAMAGFLLAIQLLRILLRSWTDIESLPFLTGTFSFVRSGLLIFVRSRGLCCRRISIGYILYYNRYQVIDEIEAK